MIKSRNSKLLISILLAIVIMVSGVVLCSCAYIFQIMTMGGYSINTIIYTNDYQKYIADRTVVEELECGSTTIKSGEGDGVWVLETNVDGCYDVVYSTIHKTTYFAGAAIGEVGPGAFNGYLEMKNSDNTHTGIVLMDNSHIFSGFLNYYEAGGKTVCTTCGESWDSETGCKNYCSPKEGVFIPDGTWEQHKENWLIDDEFNISFNELILDGYDFKVLYDYIIGYDYTKELLNWEQYYNPSNFSHMFSDLPVKKITIKNATGLGGNALDLSSMFENCTNLETIEFGNLFDNCKPTNISKMFYNCPKLKNIDLTSLDTSNVTNMSNMFAVGGTSADLEERDAILEDYINNVIVPEDDELNDGTIYTVESFAEKCEVSKELLYVIGAMKGDGLGLEYPVSYSELTMAIEEMNFADTCKAALSGELTIEGEEFDSIADVVNYIKSQASTYGITAVYDADFYANTDRDTYINYVINNLLVPCLNIEVGEEPYTLETLAEKLGYSKEKTLVEIVMATGLDIPVTYNEICEHAFDMSIDELVSAVNADPTEFGLEAKESQYTEEELIEIFSPYILSEYGFEAITEEELADYYSSKIDTTKKLILGGLDSKFVIKNGTDISNLFGDSCEFGIIVAPNEMGDEIELILNRVYSSDNVDMVTKITANDTSKTFTYQREIETPKDPEPEEPIEDVTPNVPNSEDEENEEKEMNLATIIIIVSGGIVIFGGVSTSLIVVIKKKKKPMTIKGQRL